MNGLCFTCGCAKSSLIAYDPKGIVNGLENDFYAVTARFLSLGVMVLQKEISTG